MQRRARTPSGDDLGWLAGLALCVAALLLLPDVTARQDPSGGWPGPRAGSTSGTALTVQALDVLHAWDRRRRAAWSTGDADRLRALYVAGSRTGRRDVRLLRAYAARGLRVTRLRMQVRRARVVRAEPGRAVLALTERLAGGEVHHGARTVPLPGDHYSRRMVTLQWTAGEWLVAEVGVR